MSTEKTILVDIKPQHNSNNNNLLNSLYQGQNIHSHLVFVVIKLTT